MYTFASGSKMDLEIVPSYSLVFLTLAEQPPDIEPSEILDGTIELVAREI